MFLGYSEKEETFLKQHNNVTVLDAVSSLDNFMREEVNNQVRRRPVNARPGSFRNLSLRASNAGHITLGQRFPLEFRNRDYFGSTLLEEET